MVAERSLQHERLRGIDVSLEHDLRLGGHLEVAGDRLGQLHRLAAEEAGEEELVDRGRQRRRAGIDAGRIAAERDDDRHPLAFRGHLAPVRGADLVPLPVHGERVAAEHLDAVHADVADAARRIAW